MKDDGEVCRQDMLTSTTFDIASLHPEPDTLSNWDSLDRLQEDTVAFVVAMNSLHGPARAAQDILELRNGPFLSIEQQMHLYTGIRTSQRIKEVVNIRTIVSMLYTNSFTVP